MSGGEKRELTARDERAAGGSNAGRAARDSGARRSRRSPAEPRIRKNFRLSQAKIERAKQALGTRTDTETIEAALDLAAFGARLAQGIEAMKGFRWRGLPEGEQG